MSRFIIQAAPLPPDFSGTLQEMFDAMLDRMEVVTDGSLFITASSLPPDNQGPVLLHGTQWWVWDEDAQAYIPLDISPSVQAVTEVFTGEVEPVDGTPRVWFKTSGTSYLGTFIYMGTTLGYVAVDALAPGSITLAMIPDGLITAAKLAPGVIPTLASITGVMAASSLAPGSAYQIPRTNAAASAVQWEDLFKETSELSIVGSTPGGDDNVVYASAHGLSVIPKYRSVVLVCKVDENGYKTGDETDALAAADTNDADKRNGLVADTTNLTFIKRTTFQIPYKDGTQRFLITTANWRLKFIYSR